MKIRLIDDNTGEELRTYCEEGSFDIENLCLDAHLLNYQISGVEGRPAEDTIDVRLSYYEVDGETDKIRPCPFCGSEASYRGWGTYEGCGLNTRSNDHCHVIVCKTCGAVGRLFCDKKNAINAWNKRARCGYEIDMAHTWKGGNVYMIKHDNTDKTKQVREYFISEA